MEWLYNKIMHKGGTPYGFSSRGGVPPLTVPDTVGSHQISGLQRAVKPFSLAEQRYNGGASCAGILFSGGKQGGHVLPNNVKVFHVHKAALANGEKVA